MNVTKLIGDALNRLFWLVPIRNTSVDDDGEVTMQVGNETDDTTGIEAEVWGVAGVQSRPQDESGGEHAKCIKVQFGETVLVLGTHDPRHLEPCESGELLIHALGKTGSSRALIRLKPDGTVQVEGDAVEVCGNSLKAAVASQVETELEKIKTAITNAGTVPNDGGAFLKLSIVNQLNVLGFNATDSTASTKLKLGG